jgi:hypothetical protein
MVMIRPSLAWLHFLLEWLHRLLFHFERRGGKQLVIAVHGGAAGALPNRV